MKKIGSVTTILLILLVVVLAIPTFGLAQYNPGIDTGTGTPVPQSSVPVNMKIMIGEYSPGINTTTGMSVTIQVVPALKNAEGGAVQYHPGIDTTTGLPVQPSSTK